MNSALIRPDKKYPLRFVWISLVFIYVLQYPLSRLMDISVATSQYGWVEWLVAYGFLIFSTSILIPAIYIGMSGKPVITYPTTSPMRKKRKIGLFTVLLVFTLFFVWSYVMLNLKIGMTIFVDFEPLPFKMVGLLFYGRLLIQPMILAYIAYSYSSSKWKSLIFVLLLALGAWAALTSGSRFVSIMFALPLLLLFKGKSRYVFFGIAVMAYIIIATLSRSFYLPFQIDDDFLIQTYANAEYQTSTLENLYLLPISYLIKRSMGIGEVLMTMNFGDITPGIVHSLQNLFAYFLPFMPQGMSVSVKNVYGLDDDSFGGFGLDLFSNYWVFFGGSLITYVFGLAFSAWLLGRTYRLFVIGLHRLGFKEGAMLVFILLFILLFEGRAFLFPWMLIAAWLFSRKNTPRLIFSIMKLFSLKNAVNRRKNPNEFTEMQRSIEHHGDNSNE